MVKNMLKLSVRVCLSKLGKKYGHKLRMMWSVSLSFAALEVPFLLEV